MWGLMQANFQNHVQYIYIIYMYSNDVYAVDGQQHNLADFFTA